MNLLHHHGLELPVFPRDEVISPYHVDTLPADQTEFTRTLVVHTIGFSYSSLKQCLVRADEELESYTQACGAQIVDHVRGLVMSDNPARGPGSELLPRGYRLAARVNIIDQVLRNRDQLHRDMIMVEDGFMAYTTGTVPNPHPERLYDIGIRQFRHGVPRGNSIAPSNWFTDVEPRFKRR